MGRLVIATCRPRPGRDGELVEILHSHVAILRGAGIVTDREPVVMRAADGAFIEVLELYSDQSLQRAQRSPSVLALWQRLQQVCDCVNVRGADEAPPLAGMGTAPLRR